MITIWKTYEMTCLTPCFCAGADQTKAEIRPASIRGALRWWYRTLGGTKDTEVRLFGGTTNGAKASQVAVRISDVKAGSDWKPDLSKEFRTNGPGGWIWYFATASGDKKRWFESGNPKAGLNPGGHLPPKTTFNLHVRTSKIAEEDPFWTSALNCFLLLGSIGMRATRGMGALQVVKPPVSESEIADLLRKKGFSYKSREAKEWKDAIFLAERYLKEELRSKNGAGHSGKRPTPLGSAEPRQMSAVWFRPIFKNSQWKLVIFEAPHDKVLGEKSRKGITRPVIEALDLSKDPPPLSQPGRRGRPNQGYRSY